MNKNYSGICFHFFIFIPIVSCCFLFHYCNIIYNSRYAEVHQSYRACTAVLRGDRICSTSSSVQSYEVIGAEQRVRRSRSTESAEQSYEVFEAALRGHRSRATRSSEQVYGVIGAELREHRIAALHGVIFEAVLDFHRNSFEKIFYFQVNILFLKTTFCITHAL